MTSLTAINVVFCVLGVFGTACSLRRLRGGGDACELQARYNLLVGDVAFLRERVSQHITDERDRETALRRFA